MTVPFYRRAMRPARVLGVYAVIVFIGGAAISPWIYLLVQNVPSFFPVIAPRSFHRFLSTILLVIAVSGIIPLLRSIGVRSFRDAGLPSLWLNYTRLAGGFSLGLLSLSAIGVVALLMGARAIDTTLTASKISRALLAGIVTAIGVAFLEEILFRSGIFAGLRRAFGWIAALFVSSAVYAAMHFLEDTTLVGPVRCWSGFELLAQLFTAIPGSPQTIARFSNLLVAGILLGLAYQRTGNIWFSIGLHAGWILSLIMYRALTDVVPGTTLWLWGTGRLIDGWAAMPALIMSVVVFMLLPAARNPNSTQ